MLHSSAGALGTTSASFALAYDANADWVSTVTSGSNFRRETPLRPDYDVIASVTTKWGSSELGKFIANYDPATGRRTGESNGSATGTPTGSWTKLLGLYNGLAAATATYNVRGELTGTGLPSWQNGSGS